MIGDTAVAAGAAVFAGLCAGFAAGVLTIVTRHRRGELPPLDYEPRLVTRYPRAGVHVFPPTFHDGEHEGWWNDPPTEEVPAPTPT